MRDQAEGGNPEAIFIGSEVASQERDDLPNDLPRASLSSAMSNGLRRVVMIHQQRDGPIQHQGMREEPSKVGLRPVKPSRRARTTSNDRSGR